MAKILSAEEAVSMIKDGDTVGIEYDFSNYGKYKGLVKNSLVITLNYADFGNIEKVEEPS